jgi:hypothetical protein
MLFASFGFVASQGSPMCDFIFEHRLRANSFFSIAFVRFLV